MSIRLTELQQHALDAESDRPRVIDPRTNAEYVLVPADEFESNREFLDDERQQAAIRLTARRNAMGRMENEL